MPSSTASRAALGLLLLGALTACAGTSPQASAPTASTTATVDGALPTAGAPATAATSTPPEVRSSPPAAQPGSVELTLVLADGEVTGDTPLARVRVGQPVRLSVTSDVADELHVHGVDETLELVPGEAEVLEFTPSSPGRFEVELHEARRVLTRLQVR